MNNKSLEFALLVLLALLGSAQSHAQGVNRYEINATGTTQTNPNNNTVITTDWDLIFDDLSGDQLVQTGEIISFTGTTVTTVSNGLTYQYDEIVGTPDAVGVSASSGFDVTIGSPCCWWFDGPVIDGSQGADGWYPTRWTYAKTLVPSDDDDGDGVLNVDDLCPGTPPGAAVGANGCTPPVVVELVMFNINSVLAADPISDKARSNLVKSLEKLAPAQADLAAGDVKNGLKNVSSAESKLLKAEGEGANVGESIDMLLVMAEEQAQDALAAAIDRGGDPEKINKALKEIDKAEDKLADGKADKAIRHYAKAWEHASKS